MKISNFFIATKKEIPSDAEIISHQLMMRAGLIKKTSSGIYSYLPLGLRVLRKIEHIIRTEMDRSGAIELLMPLLQPYELWEESDRWAKYGEELFRLKDRHERSFALQPTCEEVVTDIARQEIRSYKQLPKNVYHIQTKFRDERRPRFGVMRGREFIMKDAYSFHASEECLDNTYQTMYDTYGRIFDRLGLVYRAVAADTGQIGGSGSHEFHVIAETGEDWIAYNPNSQYASNIEMTPAPALVHQRPLATEAQKMVATPTQTTCQAVAELLGVPLQQMIKTIVCTTAQHEKPATTQLVILLVRGDHELNEVKASKLNGLSKMRLATAGEIQAQFGCSPGFLGPVNAPPGIRIIADTTVANMANWVCGANQDGYHLQGVNWGRDLPEPNEIADIRNAIAGDQAPDGGTLALCRGIEVGHIFKLGTRYSEPMGAKFLDKNGQNQTMIMGCYGIGVTRIMGAAIEQNHDDKGIIWPEAIAPFQAVICPIGYEKNPAVAQWAHDIYDQLRLMNIDVALDDRDERPGSMFADWELIGVPHRIVLGERHLATKMIEYTNRRTGIQQTLTSDELINILQQSINILNNTTNGKNHHF